MAKPYVIKILDMLKGNHDEQGGHWDRLLPAYDQANEGDVLKISEQQPQWSSSEPVSQSLWVRNWSVENDALMLNSYIQAPTLGCWTVNMENKTISPRWDDAADEPWWEITVDTETGDKILKPKMG